MGQKATPAGRQGNTIVIVLISIIALAAIGFLVYQNMQLRKQTVASTPVPTASAEAVPSIAPTPTPASTPKTGWKVYKNTQYGFEFMYPESYQVLTDSNNLYGWPKAILLLYKGGQSYDMAVELWNTEAEYKAKYTDTSSYTAFKTKDGKFITLLNANKDTEVSEIITTFKLTSE